MKGAGAEAAPTVASAIANAAAVLALATLGAVPGNGEAAAEADGRGLADAVLAGLAELLADTLGGKLGVGMEEAEALGAGSGVSTGAGAEGISRTSGTSASIGPCGLADGLEFARGKR